MQTQPRPVFRAVSDGNAPLMPERPDPEILATIESLQKAWGTGATWPQVELLTTPGAAPHWLERWSRLWQILKDAKLDDRNQSYRLRMAAELAADMVSSPSPEKTEKLESLRLDCMPPEAFADTKLDLWAACSNCGLMLLLGESDDMFRLLEDPAPYALPQIPWGRFAVVRLEAAVEIARTQAPYWAWAAAKAGVLYGVEPVPPKAV